MNQLAISEIIDRTADHVKAVLIGEGSGHDSRIRDECLRENFAWLNRLTLSLLKQHPEKDSVAMKRRACGWNDDYMLQVLTGTCR